MKEQHDSVQNRFTAYLVIAVTNKRNGYFMKGKKIREKETPDTEALEEIIQM